jgi:hypothetical protein
MITKSTILRQVTLNTNSADEFEDIQADSVLTHKEKLKETFQVELQELFTETRNQALQAAQLTIEADILQREKKIEEQFHQQLNSLKESSDLYNETLKKLSQQIQLKINKDLDTKKDEIYQIVLDCLVKILPEILIKEDILLHVVCQAISNHQLDTCVLIEIASEDSIKIQKYIYQFPMLDLDKFVINPSLKAGDVFIEYSSGFLNVGIKKQIENLFLCIEQLKDTNNVIKS